MKKVSTAARCAFIPSDYVNNPFRWGRRPAEIRHRRQSEIPVLSGVQTLRIPWFRQKLSTVSAFSSRFGVFVPHRPQNRFQEASVFSKGQFII